MDWLDKIERETGLQQPEFIQVQNGYYHQKIVLDEIVEAGFLSSDPVNATEVKFHYEPLDKPIPRYKTELIWKKYA